MRKEHGHCISMGDGRGQLSSNGWRRHRRIELDALRRWARACGGMNKVGDSSTFLKEAQAAGPISIEFSEVGQNVFGTLSSRLSIHSQQRVDKSRASTYNIDSPDAEFAFIDG